METDLHRVIYSKQPLTEAEKCCVSLLLLQPAISKARPIAGTQAKQFYLTGKFKLWKRRPLTNLPPEASLA